MDKDTILEVKNVSKKFTKTLKRSMYYGSVDIFRNMLGIPYDTSKIRKGEFLSVDNVSFTLKKGESLGVIGTNGSGKTTLLRLINGIFPPDSGKISIRGKIGALIAVGAGFHPNLTGRENIYLNATILGMSKQQIEDVFDNIIKFADIGEFIDSPVSNYSSGMNIRLGFAIAIHSDPELLLADEILAVGDLSFALKCYRKIAEFREKGGSIVLVSHSVQLIRNTCNNVLWLEKGVVKEYGDTQRICDMYEKFVLEKDSKDNTATGSIINNDPEVHINEVQFLGPEDKEKSAYKVGEIFKVRIHFDSKRKIDRPLFTVSFINPENIQVVSNYTSFDGFKIDSIDGRGYIDFIIKDLSLKPSEYRCIITLNQKNDISNVLEWHDKNHKFFVEGNEKVSYGIFDPRPEWKLTSSK